MLSKIEDKYFIQHPKEIVFQQINKLLNHSNCIDLVRTARIGDGIIKLDESQEKSPLEVYDKARLTGRFSKFIPASGAATRMFAKLHKALNKFSDYDISKIKQLSNTDDEAKYFDFLLDHLKDFAFYNDLVSFCNKNDFKIEELISSNPSAIFSILLSSEGLDYNNKPKALIKFHKYQNHSRTAFAEHLFESTFYQSDLNNNISIHFTISDSHLQLFQHEEKILKTFEKLNEFNFQITYSFQKKSTDSITLTEDNQLFFTQSGELLFRPSGHGALLENLNELGGDIVFIKNIDNVCVDNLKPITARYKKLLAGFLLMLQKQIFEFLSILEKKQDTEKLRKEIIAFSETFLNITKPDGFNLKDEESQRQFLFKKLNRPIRVCGVVKNEGEPGGAPFWIKNEDKPISLQIVEQSQINLNNDEQRLIFNNSTHFNPVDIVAGLRDYKGKNFNLLKYRDEKSYMIVEKYIGSAKAKSLELPGLWNGGMADWISVFVEVPSETFNPVKEITDLLKRGHLEK